ncbi:beta subunit of fatty acid synthetase, partial [Coemansia helicoidea]
MLGPPATITLGHAPAAISVAAAPAQADRIRVLARSFDVTGADALTPIELHARFLEHCAEHSAAAGVAVLAALCGEYGVPAASIHAVVQQHGLDEAAAQRVLRAYYLLWGADEAQHLYRGGGAPKLPALFAAHETRLAAMFGGQPGSCAYLDEARWLLDVYRPLLGGFVGRMSAHLAALALDVRLSPVYKKGLDVLGWLRSPVAAPDAEYLVSAPVSMPLTGLVQLMHVAVLHMTLGVPPGELVRRFS